MTELFTCPQGHRWEATIDDASGSGRRPAICPVCSSSAAEDAALATAPMVDELPPRPAPVPVVPLNPAAVLRRRPGQPLAPEDQPAIDGYEILEELGRGGMGVVYRARQVSLNRIVALKMILAGAHAAPEELARFRTEAETVARLPHPHVVQIYEVGQQGGRPYLALEYVDGGSLAQKLAGTPQPARQAAQLLEKLARAVHHAHQRDIVHRDLTPANVLLACSDALRGVRLGSSAEWGHYEPKITDFGLAKLVVGGGLGRTRTGAVMGTPSYMPPEQAGGRTKEIGPAVDIYALGAILYDMPTGRPPFKAASSLETLQQVVFDEPVPPIRLQPGVPRDLDTICLKCLQKVPRQRYGSALALAEDLRRFLAGEPIQARPVSSAERLARWCRRNPRVASLLAALVMVFAGGFAAVTWQWLRAEALRIEALRQQNVAEKNYDLARRVVADYFASLNSDAQLDQAGALPLRKELLETALTHFQGFLQARGDDPDLQAALASAQYCLGEIARLSGPEADAATPYQKALTIQRQLVDEHPGVLGFQRDLARTYSRMGVLQAQMSRWTEARQYNQQAFEIRERLSRADPNDPELKRELIHSYQSTGYVYHAAGEHMKALPLLQQARILREQLLRDKPDDLTYQSDLSGTLNDLGLVLEVLDRHEEALEVYRQAIQLQQPLFTQARQAIRYRRSLIIHHFNMGRVLSKLGRSAEVAESAQMCRRLNPEDPDSLWFAARVLAMAANAVGKGKPALSANEEAERQRYAAQAVLVLQEAVDYGFTDLERLNVTSFPEFGALSSRPDFEKIMRNAQNRANKSKP